jgi:hypothetical protein
MDLILADSFSLSQDFNYSKIIRLADYTARRPFGDEELEYPVKGPRSNKHGFQGTFDQPKVKVSDSVIVFTDIRPKEVRDGFHLIIHDPYEIPSEKSVNVFTLTNQTVEFLINPKIVSFDETLRTYEFEE